MADHATTRSRPIVFSTERIGALLAHRPGLMAPTLGARQLATLDQFSEGRLWVHIITGGSDMDQARDGDFEDDDTRYAPTDEYLQVLKKVWESDQSMPIFMRSGASRSMAHAKPSARFKRQRSPTVAGPMISATLAFRTVVAETEDAAWEKAAYILEKVKSQVARSAGGYGEKLSSNVGSVCLREAARRGKVLDKRLWTEVAEASGAGGNSTAPVGTPEQVADALLDYYDAGVSNFLVRGFYPTEDTVTYGRDVVPLVRPVSPNAKQKRLPPNDRAARYRRHPCPPLAAGPTSRGENMKSPLAHSRRRYTERSSHHRR